MKEHSIAPPNDGTSELQYISLIMDILQNGDTRIDRTGVGTRAVHGRTMRFSLQNNTIPLLTTKRVPWKSVYGELLWFLSGESNIRPLLLNSITIWSDWPFSKYIKKTGSSISLKEFEQKIRDSEDFAKEWGDLGPVYGVQWRRWQGPDGRTYDQISDLINELKTNPTSRRLLFHGWNVADLDKMALPPCHLLYQFFVKQGKKLSLTLYQRSCDVGLGLPFNIASAALLVHMIANILDMEADELFWVGHDVHLYTNHTDPIQEHFKRTPRDFPSIAWKRKPKNIFDYKIDDLTVIGYQPDPSIKMDVAV